MNKDFAPFLLTPFKQPPSLGDALRRSTSGNCEHPASLKEPKNPKLEGAPTASISIPGTGGRGSGGTSLTLAFDDFDKNLQEYEKDRMRWLENQLSPSREGGGVGTGGGAPLQIVSGSPSLLTVSPSTQQTQGTDPIVWTLTVSPAATGAYYA